MNKEIRAFYTEDTVRVYQAYNKVIANEAVKNGTFGSNFKLDRMTWIKSSFLWMMYRCGWGTKENQEYILAIDLKREAFDYIVKCGGVQRESIDRCLEALHLRLKQEAQKDVDEIYSVKVGDTFKNVPVQDILFFETSQKGHHVILHTECSRMDFVGNLNEIEGQMGERFIRTHRSYLVAVEKITEIDLKHNKVKAGKQECLVSRKMKSALMERVKM